jgi:hypothetical protein
MPADPLGQTCSELGNLQRMCQTGSVKISLPRPP